MGGTVPGFMDVYMYLRHVPRMFYHIFYFQALRMKILGSHSNSRWHMRNEVERSAQLVPCMVNSLPNIYRCTVLYYYVPDPENPTGPWDTQP